MADAPLTPHLQSLLFQHRLEQRRQRMQPRVDPALTTQPIVPPPVYAPPPVSTARKAPTLAPDYKGSEIQAKYDTERMQQSGATEREGMQQKGAMDRAKLNALMEIEGLRFKMLAKKAGGGHGGNLEAYLKTAAEMAKAAEGSAERETLRGILRTRYQGMPRQYRERVEASGVGFDFGAKGPAVSDIKLKAEVSEIDRRQQGAEKVARIGVEGRQTAAEKADQTRRAIAAARTATGEKAPDMMVRQAMGGKDLRAIEAEKLRAGGAATAAEPPEGFELARQKSTGKMVWLNRATGEVREPE